MTPYVMFGHSHYLGELVDLIHASDGRLAEIVENMAEAPVKGRPSLAARLLLITYEVKRTKLQEWRPPARLGARYVMGFSGPQTAAYGDEVKRLFPVEFTTLIHPSAEISDSARIGRGGSFNRLSVVASNAVVGRHVVVNRGALVGHDVELGDCAVVGPGAVVCSYVKIGRGARIGAGATVLEDLEIGEGAVVAAGATVIRNVLPGTMVAGVPAVPKKVVKQ